ncbi:MAG: DUF349 domain-containing protein [Pseudomonadota bacterium]
MIFEKLFTPKHLHKNPTKRREAINEIAEVSSSNKGWLHDLAFNDESNEVKLAALEALNEFTLWLKAYEENQANNIQKRALKQVMERIEDPIQVSNAMFEEIVLNKKYAMITKLLRQSSARLSLDDNLLLKSLLQEGDELALQRFFLQSTNHNLRASVIAHFSENEKVLRKLRKKQTTSELHDLIDENLETLRHKAEKPDQIIKAGKLLNARMNALIESHDYNFIGTNKQSLNAEFERLKAEFIYLDELSVGELTEKYLFLKARLDKRQSDLLPEYEKQQEKAKLTAQQSQISQQIESIGEQVEHLFDIQNIADFNTQHELLSNAVKDANEQCLSMSELLSSADLDVSTHLVKLKRMQQDVDSIQHKLDNALKIVENNKTLSSMLSNLQNLLSEFEIGNLTVDTLRQQFQIETDKLLSEKHYSTALMQQYNALSKAIKKHIKLHDDEQKKLKQRCMSKLRTASTLVTSGKFKAALSVFETAEQMFNRIPIPDRALTKKFQDVSQDISEIIDWQAYIAAPKKPEMILQAQSLIENAKLSIKERSAAIKQLRADYNSLGKLNTQEDDALNTEFDNALEKAFEPCRVHYAKMELQREENAKEAEAILAELSKLEGIEDNDTLLKTYDNLVTSFHAIKALDRTKHKALRTSLKAITAPIKKRIADIYLSRQQQKSRLIKQAAKLASEDLSDTAVSEAKQLQKEWKTIGFAGKGEDKRLWQEFRSCNDRIFAQLSEVKAQQDARNASLYEQCLEKLDTIMQSAELKKASSAALANKKNQLQDLHLTKDDVGIHKAKTFNAKVNDARNAIDALIAKTTKSEKAMQMESLIDMLVNNSAACSGISGNLKLGLEQKLDQHDVYDNLSKEQLFQSIFLLLDQSDAAIESSTRIALMAAKLEGREDLSPQLSLSYWLSRGHLSESDVILLQNSKGKLLDSADRIL